ncbi:MAG: TldD/PmbA family protein [candidate division Zixibacteria bacterium]|nr:TldD/PmbA family protein [candidate division Zixibacteria bacterium]
MSSISRILDKCTRSGAEMAEVYNITGNELKISVRDGKVETVTKAAPGGAAVRFFSSGRMAFAHTTDISDRAIDELVSRLSNLVTKTSGNDNIKLPGPISGILDFDIFSPGQAETSTDSKINYLNNLEQLALEYDPLIKHSNGTSYTETATTLNLANTNGLDISYESTRYKVGLSVAAVKNEEKFPGEGSFSARHFEDLPSADEIVDLTAAKAVRLIGGSSVDSGNYEIIFTPGAARSIIWGLIYALNGESYLKGSSFLAGKEGEKFADSALSVYDDATMPRGIASRPIDDEGSLSKKLMLIENGTLKTAMYDMKTATKAGISTTASASREDYKGFPEIAPSNFYIAAGKDKVSDVVASCRKGILVETTQGWGLHSITGQYSAGINGILIRNGQSIKPVTNVTLAASTEDLFRGIGAICDDLTFYNKYNAPSIMIEKMKIGA